MLVAAEVSRAEQGLDDCYWWHLRLVELVWALAVVCAVLVEAVLAELGQQLPQATMQLPRTTVQLRWAKALDAKVFVV
jgi:hypothetical protein